MQLYMYNDIILYIYVIYIYMYNIYILYIYIYFLYTYNYIKEYGSTVGMAPKENGHPYISIAGDELKSLLKL